VRLVALLAAAAIVSSASAAGRLWEPSMSALRGIAARLLRGLGSAENVP
jgi:hypothetical protein